MSPFEEDVTVNELAEGLGFKLRRKPVVVIEDEAALCAAGLTTTSLDWTRIRKLLDSGASVAGARLDGIEYVLRPLPTDNGGQPS